jgi:hypothetical protein
MGVDARGFFLLRSVRLSFVHVHCKQASAEMCVALLLSCDTVGLTFAITQLIADCGGS